LPLNQIAANEKPSSTPAKAENRARYVMLSDSIGPRRSA
jgi:hypothetical protein